MSLDRETGADRTAGRRWLRSLASVTAVASACAAAAPAQAYIGISFLEVPGIVGGWKGESYRNWVRLEANYWGKPKPSPPLFLRQNRTRFSAPLAPKSGAGALTVSLTKGSPGYAGLMDQCRRKALLPELSFAESSDRARPPAELGRRPSDIPEYYEYTLRGVTLSCPEAEGAPEQALVLAFQDIQWRNFSGEDRQLSTAPAKLPSAAKSGRSLAYVVTWFVSANSVKPDQCPVFSAGPTEADYYAYKTPEQAAAEKAERAPKGGIMASFITGALAWRGPGGLNAALLPGIVPDPGQPAPQAAPDRGFDLDGKNGRSGSAIDNRFFSVDGCIKGFGPKGILTVTTIEGRRNGEISMMVLISGIDDEKNDDRVDVTLFYSPDPMIKSASGKDILPGYTFRVSRDPERTPYFKRLRARIIDGVVVTEPTDVIEIDKGRDIARFHDGRMRLELGPNRTLKGVVGGYQDWRSIANYWGALTIFEAGMGYKVPGVYNALRRSADGLKDPVTGEYNGISSVFDIEGVQAFIPPEEERALLSSGVAYAK